MKFLKKKPLYIVLIIIFTLILIADLIIRFGVSSGSKTTRTPGNFENAPSGFSSSFDPSNMPSDFDPSSMGGNFPGGSFPGGNGDFDPSTFPGGDFDPSSMSGFDPSTMQGGSFDPSTMQGGDFSGFPGGSRPGSTSSEKKGFISTVKKFWIPIAIVCVLVDAFCVFMLLRIRKNQKNDPNNAASHPDDDETPIRRQSHWLLFLVPILVIAIVLKVLPMAKKQAQQSSVTVKEKVLSVDVSAGKISNTYLAGGTLSEDSASSVSVPGSILIDSYAVSNGDLVSEGDLIATVNKDSVMAQIYDIQTLLADLDEDLKEELDTEDAEKIISSTAGRVKAVYSEEGKAVVDTVSENGALMLISLDGLMSIDVESDSLKVGDSVTVVLPDESEEAGRVLSALDGTATIAVSDENTGINDAVTVKDKDGNTIATGNLKIHSELKIVAYQGVVEKVDVEVGDEVKSGDTLLTLKNAERSANYLTLVSERDELMDQMEKLFALYQSGEIRAEASGEISNLNEDILIEDETEEKDTIEVAAYGYVMLLDPEQPDAPAQNDEPAPTETQDQPQTQEPAPSQEQGQSQDPGQQQNQQGQQGDQDQQGQMQGQNGQSGMPSGFGDGSQGGMPSGFGDGKPSGTGNTSIGSGMNAGTQENSTQETKKQSTYSISETAVYSIAARETMTIDVSVDELDIRGLKEGQDVTVSLDALPGQSFDGKITSISKEGTYDSGNTKFTVTVSVAKTEQMLSGMHAGIRADVGEAKTCITVPVAALLEENGKTYVYTMYDEETDKLDGLTEVTTGLSDGTNVEILSGVSEGSKVYYRYADTLEYVFVRP